MKFLVLAITFFGCIPFAFTQVSQDSIHTNYVLQKNRSRFDMYLRDTAVNLAFSQALDSNSEYDFENACLAVSQFMIQSPVVEAGFNKLFVQYDSLQYTTRRSFLESLYGLYPGTFENDVRILLSKETNVKLFAIEAAYLLEHNASQKNKQIILGILHAKFPGAAKNEMLLQLTAYIYNHEADKKKATPPIADLFAHQKQTQQKTIYSLQRWNRDYPGLAIVQNADGSFCRDSTGKLLVVEQLARAASNLPYFITDGNTPQGVFSITGLEISHNNFLGPTPNIQMLMPFENDDAYWGDAYDNHKDALTNYLGLLPASWQKYLPLTEAFYAGKLGRSAVIAHGTTLNPVYFATKPYYPISPTLGCLCAKEIWDTSTGKLLQSEQLNLVNAWLSTPGDTGYTMVINIDNQQKPVSREEAEELVKKFEGK